MNLECTEISKANVLEVASTKSRVTYKPLQKCIIRERQPVITQLLIMIIICYHTIVHVYCCSNRTDECIPDIMWCREPFMEALNEIEDVNLK